MAKVSRGRRPAGSGTREAIAGAARQLFAKQSYQRTSLRGIAAQAGVDPRLVLHFFGSKQALFVAVVDLPFDPEQVFDRLFASGTPGIGRRLASFVLSILDDPDSNAVMTGLIRAAASEEDARHMVREMVTERMLLPLARRVGREDAELRADLVASQIVGLVLARHVVGLSPLADAPSSMLVAALAPVLDHYLTGDLAGSEPRKPGAACEDAGATAVPAGRPRPASL